MPESIYIYTCRATVVTATRAVNTVYLSTDETDLFVCIEMQLCKIAAVAWSSQDRRAEQFELHGRGSARVAAAHSDPRQFGQTWQLGSRSLCTGFDRCDIHPKLTCVCKRLGAKNN